MRPRILILMAFGMTLQNCGGPVIEVVGVPHIELLSGALGGSGHRDGIGADARFFEPSWMVSDETGTIYIGDGDLGSIRRYDPRNQKVTTLVYEPGCERRRRVDAAITISPSQPGFTYHAGKIYLSGETDIFAIDVETGARTTVFTFDAYSQAAALTFDNAENLFAMINVGFAGHIEKIDLVKHEHRIVAGSDSFEFAAAKDGIGSDARFLDIRNGLFDGQNALFLTEAKGNIRRFDLATSVVTTVRPMKNGWEDPRGLWQAGVVLYLTDSSGIWSQDLNSGATHLIYLYPQLSVASGGRTHEPYGIVGDGQGAVYVTDLLDRTLDRVDISSGDVSVVAGRAPEYAFRNGTLDAARYSELSGVAYSDNQLFVTELTNATVREIDQVANQVTNVVGFPGGQWSEWHDGIGMNAQLSGPTGIITTNDGNFYVYDSYAIRKGILRNRELLTIAGIPSSAGFVESTALSARFNAGLGLVWDGKKFLYVAQTIANSIWRVAVDSGESKWIVGDAFGHSEHREGVGYEVPLRHPSGLLLDGDSLYVTDDLALYSTQLATFQTRKLLDRPAALFHSAVPSPWVMAQNRTGTIYLADARRGVLERYDPKTNTLTLVAGQPGIKAVSVGPLPATLNTPWAMTFLPNGDLIMVDNAEGAVVKISGPLP